MKVRAEAWDKHQLDVIKSKSYDRILVDAGPGTGKTAVACARVAYLIDNEGLEPSNIWLVSFTRTAVREIRDRINSYLSNGDNAFEVRIATLDSHAWSIHSGFDETAKMFGSYEQNIEKLIQLIKSDENVVEYLQGIEHLIVDEAQDIVGVRANLLIEIIARLNKTCGVTVFSDQAQAIYGFTTDNDESETAGSRLPTVVEMIRERFGRTFKELQLDRIYRTDSKKLQNIFTIVRKSVMDPQVDPVKKLDSTKYSVKYHADNMNLPQIQEQNLEHIDNCLILYRKRSEVLLASSFLIELNQKHRIRMSGLPSCIHPWIGVCLSENTDNRLSKQDFQKKWDEKISGSKLEIIDEKSAWKQFVRLAGVSENVVDINKLRMHLGRSKPPAELCQQEIGENGPILGTIHASKGREADEVRLMMPGTPGKNTDHEEEARVVFVGATRAKKILGIGYGYKQRTQKIAGTDRVYALHTDKGMPNAQVEIGREYDINSKGIAGREHFSSSSAVTAIQQRLYGLAGRNIMPRAIAYSESFNKIYKYNVKLEKGLTICYLLNDPVRQDLWDIGKEIKRQIGGNHRPPDKLKNLGVFGIRTLVLPPESPECEQLIEPFNRSGIMLAPVILGYTTEYFPYYN